MGIMARRRQRSELSKEQQEKAAKKQGAPVELPVGKPQEEPKVVAKKGKHGPV